MQNDTADLARDAFTMLLTIIEHNQVTECLSQTDSSHELLTRVLCLASLRHSS